MADPEAIYHSRRDRITTSGQPTEPQLKDLHALGIRHIVNLGLHSHEKALPDETASVSRLGMTYNHIMVFKLVNVAAKTWRRLKGENQLPKVVQGVRFHRSRRTP